MDKDEWMRANKALQVASLRLTAELRKLTEKKHFIGLDAAGTAAQQHSSSIFAAVTDAKQHLTALQQQILQVQQPQPPPASFIQDLATHISKFTDLLSNLKSQQRQQYSSLLQQEQELLKEVAGLQLSLDDSTGQDPVQDEFYFDSSHSRLQDTHFYSSSHASPANNSPIKMQRQRSSTTACDTTGSAVKTAVRPSTAGAMGSRKQASQQAIAGSAGRTSSSSTIATPRVCSSASGVCGSTLLPEVVAHDQFVARHGPTGGWHPDDHNVFLATLRRSRGDYSAALAAAVDALPGITRQQVIAHSRWHADLTELDMRRRVALVNWRAARDAAKAARQAEATILQDTHASAQAQQQPPDQLEKVSRQLRKQIVAQWKAEQAAAQQQKAAVEAEQQRRQREREHVQLQQKRAALRQQLEAAKAAKQKAAAADAVAQAAAAQAAASPSMADLAQQHQVQQRLAERNAAAMIRRQQLLAAKQDKQAARKKAQQQLLAEIEDAKPRVSRDSGRLLSATAAAAARAAQAAEEAAGKQAEAGFVGRGSTGSGFVLHLGRRAVPSWASGMRL